MILDRFDMLMSKIKKKLQIIHFDIFSGKSHFKRHYVPQSQED
jgi:hypothetical protein